MKTITNFTNAFIVLLTFNTFAQNATVRATNFDISDNLDLRAVASIFGESTNLEDFESRLNNPRLQISNLDLNNDSQVDYLRVIESIDNNLNLIVVQAVLGRDMFQDVATIELERNNRSNMVVQIVGNPYFYGNNYIYEPVFVTRPVIYDYFWVHNYRPYCSPWHWGYFPGYFVAWNPFPIFRYRTHIHGYIGINNVCHYSNFRRYERAATFYQTRRNNYYERSNPNRSFSHRNANVSNRYELSEIREGRTNSRSLVDNRKNSLNTDNSVRNNTVRADNAVRTEYPVRNSETTRGNTISTDNAVRNTETTRGNTISTDNAVRNTENTRGNSISTDNTVRNTENTRTNYQRNEYPVRNTETTRGNTISTDNAVRNTENTRTNYQRNEYPVRNTETTRGNSERNYNSSKNNSISENRGSRIESSRSENRNDVTRGGRRL